MNWATRKLTVVTGGIVSKTDSHATLRVLTIDQKNAPEGAFFMREKNSLLGDNAHHFQALA